MIPTSAAASVTQRPRDISWITPCHFWQQLNSAGGCQQVAISQSTLLQKRFKARKKIIKYRLAVHMLKCKIINIHSWLDSCTHNGFRIAPQADLNMQIDHNKSTSSSITLAFHFTQCHFRTFQLSYFAQFACSH